MLEDIWNGILELTARFVIPDWGALIALLPVFMFKILRSSFPGSVVWATLESSFDRQGYIYILCYIALMRDEYPPFRLDQGEHEPADAEPEPATTPAFFSAPA